jgi:hypothetical protein
MYIDGIEELFDAIDDSNDKVFLPPLPFLPVDDLTFEKPTHDSLFAKIFANTQMHIMDFNAYSDRGTQRSAEVALQHTQQLQCFHSGLRIQIREYLQRTNQMIPITHILEVYGRLYTVPVNVREYLCHSDQTAFQELRTSM